MEAECSDDVMKLRVKFNATFSGLVYSAGKTTYIISKKFLRSKSLVGVFTNNRNFNIAGQNTSSKFYN